MVNTKGHIVQENTPPRPLLEVKDLAFGYAGHPLLYGVHMSIQAGEMVGLLGPNGSGKTTLLRLVSGLLHPQQGQILLAGRTLENWKRRSLARMLAVVPQELQVPFAFTVEQMVLLGRTPFINLFGSHSKRDHEIVRDAMSVARVDGLAKRIFNELSGGERQRVTLAMALAQQPRLLLLDEPTSHLDIKYQIEMLELVKQLNREMGITAIAAMHDLNLAARYFPRLLLFQRGIVADGGPAIVLEPCLLQRVYDVNVQVGVMHGAEYLSVLPPSNSVLAERQQQHEAHVHVMAGGGSGALVMRALADVHIPFSAGALNIGDSDYTLALRLASTVIGEQPFAPIALTTRQTLRACLRVTSLLIICPMPIGPGNLALLQEALSAQQFGLPVMLLLSPIGEQPSHSPDISAILQQISKRDYASGEGTKLFQQLLENGAAVSVSVSEAIEKAGEITREKSPQSTPTN